jgi:uncharacterized protein involved in exopolysaccharide biosynthesis
MTDLPELFILLSSIMREQPLNSNSSVDMSEPIEVNNRPQSLVTTRRSRKFYLNLWFASNILMWSLVLLILKLKPPSYISKWSVNVPFTSSARTNVFVPGIGQASSSADSAYKTFADPRENYKFLITSDEVLAMAATQLDIPVKQVGKPRVKVVENTTLMLFEIEGSTPEEAKQKALAIQSSFEDKLIELREQEISQNDRTLESAISSDREKLQQAQNRLSSYKIRSSLRSREQLNEVTLNIEELRKKRSELKAELQKTYGEVTQLSTVLGLSVEQAANALTLRADQLFQQYLVDYSRISSEMAMLQATFTTSSPDVISTQAALLRQSRLLLNQPISMSSLEELIAIGGSSSDSSSQQANLFHQLLTLISEYRGFEAQIKELDRQIPESEARLATLSEQEAVLDNYERDTKIAEAVFSGNLTRLNLSRADISASYPQTASLTGPSLPEEPSLSRSALAAFVAAALGSTLLTTGFISLWLRDRRAEIVVSQATNSLNSGVGAID